MTSSKSSRLISLRPRQDCHRDEGRPRLMRIVDGAINGPTFTSSNNLVVTPLRGSWFEESIITVPLFCRGVGGVGHTSPLSNQQVDVITRHKFFLSPFFLEQLTKMSDQDNAQDPTKNVNVNHQDIFLHLPPTTLLLLLSCITLGRRTLSTNYSNS